MLTEAQLAALEKAKTEKEAHGEFESEQGLALSSLRNSRHRPRGNSPILDHDHPPCAVFDAALLASSVTDIEIKIGQTSAYAPQGHTAYPRQPQLVPFPTRLEPLAHGLQVVPLPPRSARQPERL